MSDCARENQRKATLWIKCPFLFYREFSVSPLFQGWSLPLWHFCVLSWPCLWSVWQESVWPSLSQRVCLHSPWLTSSLLYPSSSWWWDAKTHTHKIYMTEIIICSLENAELFFTSVLFPLFPLHPPVLGLWRFSCQSQFHAELALLAEMDQYLQIWTKCKIWKIGRATAEGCGCENEISGVEFSLSSSVAKKLFSPISLSLSGCIHQRDERTGLLQQRDHVSAER